MYKRDYRDLMAGAFLSISGILIVFHTAQTLSFGTIRQMGPGMFPMSLGVILIGLGIAVLIPALFREGTLEKIEWRPAIAVLSSIIAFAVTIQPLGLIPAIAALMLIAGFAEKKYRPVMLLMTCILISAFSYLVFRTALGLPLVMFRWPF